MTSACCKDHEKHASRPIMATKEGVQYHRVLQKLPLYAAYCAI